MPLATPLEVTRDGAVEILAEGNTVTYLVAVKLQAEAEDIIQVNRLWKPRPMSSSGGPGQIDAP